MWTAGASPTAEFLKGFGFPKDNPPNAVLVVEAAPGDTDIAVLELFNPQYDEASRTATYDVQLLEHDEQAIGMTFAEQPTDLAQRHSRFGASHLLIDDCANHNLLCTSQSTGFRGVIGYMEFGGFGYSWRQAACLPCDPWFQWTEDALS